MLPHLLDRVASSLSRHDAAADDVERLLADLEVYVYEIFDSADLSEILIALGDEISRFNAAAMNGQFRELLGVDVFGTEPWLEERAKMFASDGAALIKSIPEKFHDEIASAIYRAVRQGTTQGELEDAIEERYGVAESRAALIARDQVSKFNGELTKARQTELGVEKYRWRTSGDERVRESHREKEGKIFSWDDPPADTGAPGEDVNCRCTAEPVFEESDRG